MGNRISSKYVLTTSQFLSMPQCPQSSQFTLVNCVWSGAESWEAEVRHLPVLVHVQSTTVQRAFPGHYGKNSHFLAFSCPSPLCSEGPIDINMSEIGMDDIHQLFSRDSSIKLGGHWEPSDCVARWKVSATMGCL